MGILAVYDTVGIQNYIFSSNKLAENVGGSKLVADIFAKGGILPKVIDDITQQSEHDWRVSEGLNHELKAEIIYQGGGNAYVAFFNDSIGNDKVFQDVTKEFLIRVNQKSPEIGVAIAAIETDFGDTYEKDFKKLNKRLSLVKGGFNIPAWAGSQPITKQSARTGQPVSFYDHFHKEYMSIGQKKKRDRYRDYRKPQKEELKSELGRDYDKDEAAEINDFDDLAFEKGSDSLIAIIHVDGNNMGKNIKDFMSSFSSYADAVPEIRKLSKKITACYAEALARTVESFKEEYGKYIKKLRDKYPVRYANTSEKDYDIPPLIELIGDGDDITLVISGRFAIDFAARLLREIELTKVNDRPFKDTAPTACAGVILFNSHYPFSEAYKLAEDLCASAKKPSRYSKGSHIDFHLHHSGNVAGLSQLRKQQYVVDKKTIIRRPWRVTDGCEDEYPIFSWFEKTSVDIIKRSQKDGSLPRNKTKAIRNSIGAGEIAAKLAVDQLRDAKLPNIKLLEHDSPEAMSEYAAIFDVLELCDTYENLLNKEGNHNDCQ